MTLEEYFLKLDKFLIYIEKTVNPARIKMGLKPIGRSEASTCAITLWAFEKKWEEK